MSCLKSFSFGTVYGKSEVPPEVWALFTDMNKNPSKSVQYTCEILKAGLLGRIDLSSPFSMEAYCRTIDANLKLVEYQGSKKLLRIQEDSALDEINGLKWGNVTLSRASLVTRMKDQFEEILDSDELKFAVSQISSLNEEFIINEGINVVEVLKNAVRGIPSAVERLKYICDNFSQLAEYVKTVLSSGVDVEDCFA